jgi:nucleotide-binding universal stress UspA family protein
MPVVGVGPTLNLERIMVAKALAMRFGSAVDVVHVLDPDGHAPIDDGLLVPTHALRAGIRNLRLEGVEEDLRRSGVEAASVLREASSAGREILACMEERGADLVVMGTQCKGGVQRFLLGSTAEEVIRNATRPVLTVGPNTRPAPAGPLGFKNIVYATDFSAHAAKAAVFALSFAEDSRGHLYYCHVPDGKDVGRDRRAADEAFRAELQLLVPAMHG